VIERERCVLLWTIVATNAFATAAMMIGPALPAGVLPAKVDPFARTSGWKAVAAAVREHLGKDGYSALAVDSRDLAAELIYYLRDSNVPLLVITSNDVPANHFELTRPYRAGAPEPVLLVSRREQSSAATEQFTSAGFLGSKTVPGGGREGRTLRFYSLADFVGRQAGKTGAAPDEGESNDE